MMWVLWSTYTEKENTSHLAATYFTDCGLEVHTSDKGSAHTKHLRMIVTNILL